MKRYRVSKATANTLLEQISDKIIASTNRNHAVSPLEQLLLNLRFFAAGNFYITIGDYGGLHKSTAGKIIRNVAYALARLRERYIHLPTTEAAKQSTAIQFSTTTRFPRV
ncbi:hypothetical protein MML48_9g00007548 [Holotrichia oblita]|uniref:Uncharacterized protein n=2 Tax=Holotrichia oblita TaxID=644536 RepID=A0ACB9SKK8_HOLOL|nr:hypothetical protein MML48_9g00004444 [Holotrichia oblita]KAI4455542.1 hypothetical protein MML48_9g00007548 [Holotrichia oblita]